MQDWKKAEKDFEDHFSQYGKAAFVGRLTDTASAKAIAGKRAFVAAQPSDYIVTVEGQTFYAEVKSTKDERSFHFSNIRKGQLTASRRVVKARGVYLFFVKSEYHGQWYCVPAQKIHEVFRQKKHLTWIELEEYKYDL